MKPAFEIFVLSIACHALGAVVVWGGMAAAAEPSSKVVLRGQQVYRANCAVCHGSNGDGDGNAAHMLRVRPRDFRQGVFKFRSTPAGSLPTDGDLLEAVTQGMRWTAMLGRADLPEADRRAVVQYLKTFSYRFATEIPAPAVIVPPAPTPSRTLVEQGGQIYREFGCPACHGAGGQGDGPSAAGLRDVWGWPTRPSDLTWRPLKRGSSPETVYLTVATGLSGTPMPYVGGSLESAKIWALVYFLDSLVPPAHRLSPSQDLGEESRGRMMAHMGRMMGPGGMMHHMDGAR